MATDISKLNAEDNFLFNLSWRVLPSRELRAWLSAPCTAKSLLGKEHKISRESVTNFVITSAANFSEFPIFPRLWVPDLDKITKFQFMSGVQYRIRALTS